MTRLVADDVLAWLPVVAVVVIGSAAIVLLNWLLLRRSSVSGRETRVWRHLVLALATLAVIIAAIAALPIAPDVRGQLLSVVGLVLSAVIGLSATTFVGNAMAGLMLRALNKIRPGDFVQIGEHFGKVSEFGLLHTELQTEQRTLITIPNLHLVSQPVEVVRSSGTMIDTTVSLGFDVPRRAATEALSEAANAAGLRDAFVHILEIGDYAITYRVAGLLENVRYLLSARSALRESVLDTLHGAGIEIASPALMNQRRYPPEWRFMPPQERVPLAEPEQPRAENIVFDKAEAAETAQRIRERLEALEAELDEARAEGDDDRIARLEDAQRHLQEKLAEFEV